jgi:hypothetical protein
MLKFFDYENIQKARRSLLIFAIGTLIFASITLTKNELSFLGLEISISHERLVAVGRISTAILLFFYILKIIPDSIAQYKDSRIDSVKLKHEFESAQVKDSLAPFAHRDFESPEQEIFFDLNDSHETDLRRFSARISPIVSITRRVSWLIIDHIFPLSVGLICVLDPHSLDHYLTYIELKQVQP